MANSSRTYPYYCPQENVYKPWIDVCLGFRKTHKVLPQNVLALIDSGADYCIFHATIGEQLGLDITKGKELIFLIHQYSKP